MMEIFYEFNFDAAHQFMHKPAGHKYRALHGHSFRAEIAVVGQPAPETGFIVDFALLEQACEKLRETLDHSFLNEVEGLTIPSLENISRWIWQRLQPQFPGLHRVAIRRDSCRQGCVYYGDGDIKSD